LVIYALFIHITFIFLRPHFVYIFDCIVHDVSRGRPNVPEKVDFHVVVAKDHGVVNKLYWVLVLERLDVVVKFLIFLMKIPNLLNFF
jgi:hypothetical protein